jgi:RHS repeat-associated protein
MTAGAAYTVTVTMVNTGTTRWTTASAYALGSRNPYDNLIWGGGRVGLAGPVAPGQSAAFTFNVTAPAAAGSYNFQWAMVQDGVEWFGPPSDNVIVNVVAPRQNNAQFVSQTVPAAMTAGQGYGVNVLMRNTGNTTWSAHGDIGLASANPRSNNTWNAVRIDQPATTSPGETASYAFQVVAPAAPGTYNFQWNMVQDGVEWFGAPSDNVVVAVNAAPSNGAAAIAMQVPPLIQGQNATVSVTIQNTGTTTWPAGSNYKLGSKDPDENLIWGVQRVDLANDVAPGQQTTFTFPITAPAAGTYTMQWQMMQRYVQWFGDVASAPVTVAPPAPAPDGAVTYLHTDALGSPVARSDSAGNVIARTAYEPYGRTASGNTPTIGFTGHVNDGDTGLVYMQQRYYDPVAGRFLSVDPVITDVNTGARFNRFAYANNNPFKYLDPDGREARGIAINCMLGNCETVGSPSRSRSRENLPSVNGGAEKAPSLVQVQLSRGGHGKGLISWEPDPDNPFAATPAFTAAIANTAQEVDLAATIAMISVGAYPARETLAATDPKVSLPGNRKALYDIYSVGPPDNPGPQRIAHQAGSNIYYYSPYHYMPGPGVPNGWIKLTFGLRE